MDGCLRNKERESRNRRREKGQSWEPSRVLGTHVQLGSPQPHSTALLPRETHQMDPHTHKKKKPTKKANRGSFLFDFKIPGMKKEGAPWSWCPLPRLAPSPKELPPATAPNPSYVVGTLAWSSHGGSHSRLRPTRPHKVWGWQQTTSVLEAKRKR